MKDSSVCDRFKGMGSLTYLKSVLGKPPGALSASRVSLSPQLPTLSEGHSQPLCRVGDSAHHPRFMGTSGPSTCESELLHPNANRGSRSLIDSIAFSAGCGQGGVLS